MSGKIFIVQGSCGMWDDHCEWDVVAYTDKEEAQKHADAANEWEDSQLKGRCAWDESINPFDAFYQTDTWGTHYEIHELELKEKFGV